MRKKTKVLLIETLPMIQCPHVSIIKNNKTFITIYERITITHILIIG
jgi:hypothetical protein